MLLIIIKINKLFKKSIIIFLWMKHRKRTFESHVTPYMLQVLLRYVSLRLTMIVRKHYFVMV